MGGIRIAPWVTADEVAALARKMTLKLALAELPIGGAKAGIVCELLPGPERDRWLAAFGELAGPLLRGGVYLGSDMGCSYRDRDLILQSAGYSMTRAALPSSWAELWEHCANVTGHGVAHATIELAQARGLRAGRKTVVIQGFGVVGRGAAQVLQAHGYSIVAIADAQGTIWKPGGLPIDRLCERTSPQGLVDRQQLPPGCQASSQPDAWIDVDAGVLVLAAGSDAIGEHNVERVCAEVVAEGANLPTTLAAQQRLSDRGIAVAPDILASIGGAMVTALFLCGQVPPGLGQSALVKWLFHEVATRVRKNTEVAYARSIAERRSLYAVCEQLAQERALQIAQRTPALVTSPSS